MSQEPLLPARFERAAQLETIVRGFEACTIAPAEFSHRAHLAVALWYVAHLPDAEAAARMRAGLHRFIAHHHAGDKYHETITLFWLKLVRHFLERAGAGQTLPAVANDLLARCGDAQLLYAHYSRALIQTPAAKSGWVEPDLRPLAF
ncbi:MAG TPA: hypothetical protein VF546_00425 [Pyrinomonadaceae bacterium]